MPTSSLAAPAAKDTTVAWFQKTEQSLMDAVGTGDKKVWDEVMSPDCVVTTEDGEVFAKPQFLKDIRGLPPGLSGNIVVKDLTVQQVSDFAIVRYMADETETVFGQKLATRYRVTDTFRRSGSAWKMLASHITVVNSDPPAQDVSKDGWLGLAGDYQLKPGGWVMHVELRDGQLYGGRDATKLLPFIPLTPDAFALSGSLGTWIFVKGKDGRVTHMLDYRKCEPIVWRRVDH
jgi:Domain of unknown function (DUF4440)